MSLLNEDIKYYRTKTSGIYMDEEIFNELVYRIHNLEKSVEVKNTVNILLDRKVNKLVSLCWDIRDYLIECKQDKTSVDIDKLLSMLD